MNFALATKSSGTGSRATPGIPTTSIATKLRAPRFPNSASSALRNNSRACSTNSRKAAHTAGTKASFFEPSARKSKPERCSGTY